jgi:hypothetical protein
VEEVRLKAGTGRPSRLGYGRREGLVRMSGVMVVDKADENSPGPDEISETVRMSYL